MRRDSFPGRYARMIVAMRLKRSFLVLLTAFFLSACASRIEKLPVPQKDKMQAHRMMIQGDQLLRQNKDHLALLKYLEASTHDPYNETIFNKLGIAYARLLQFERAARAIDRAIRLNPDYAFAHNTRGIVHLAENSTGRAVKSFKRAIRLMPSKYAFHVNLGNAHVQRGEFEMGRAAFLAALAINPGALSGDHVIEISTTTDEPDPERYYRMAVMFADIEAKANCLRYLEKALSNGFKDGPRLQSEKAFDEFREDPDFIELLAAFGLHLS